MKFKVFFAKFEENTKKNVEKMLVGIQLNIIVTLVLSTLGILMFKLMWLKNDNYKLPTKNIKGVFEDASSDVSYNKLWPYFKRIKAMVFDADMVSYVKRYGFENTLYLIFHKNYMVACLMCTCLLFLFFVINRWVGGKSLNRVWDKIIGHEESGLHKHVFEDCTSMLIITFCFGWAAFETIRNAKVIFLLQFKRSKRDTSDPYYYTYRTALLNVRSTEPVDPDKMMGFMQKIQKNDGTNQTKILFGYPIDNFKSIGRKMTQIDDS